MKNLLIFLALAVAGFAQTPQNVQKGGAAGTNNLTGDFNISAGRTVTVSSGGTLAVASGGILNLGSATINWSAITGTPTTLSGYGITDPVVLTSGSYANPSWITSLAAGKVSGVLVAGNMPAYTGDVTSGSGATINTLATVNGSPGTIGSGTAIPVVTVNGKGLVTSTSTAALTPAWTNVTGTPTTAAGYGIANGANIDAWGLKTVPTGTVLGTTDTQTLTNKTISGASNTLTVRLANDITGFGTGIAAALAVNTGSAGAPVLFNGAGGTPSSIVLTNATGTASGLTAGHVSVVPALTGNVTTNGTTNATTVVTVPGTAVIGTGVTHTSYDDFTKIFGPPANPANGFGRIYYDSAAENISSISSAGVWNHGIQSSSGGSSPHAWVNAINDDGSVVYQQALFTDISGVATAAQTPAFTGDVTKPSGSAAQTLATVNSNVGSFGDATHTVTFTVNGKGLVTAASQQTVTPAATSLTGVVPSANGGAGSVNGILKANGSGTTSQAAAGTDYVSPTGAETVSNKTLSGTNAVTGTITPTQILFNLDNYNPSGLSTATTLILTSDGGNAYAINGIAGGSDGRTLWLFNANTNAAATYQFSLAPEASSSTAANRFATSGAPTYLTQGKGVMIRYDGAASRWRVINSPPAVVFDDTTNADLPLVFVPASGSTNRGLNISDNATINPSTGNITASFTGDLNGISETTDHVNIVGITTGTYFLVFSDESEDDTTIKNQAGDGPKYIADTQTLNPLNLTADGAIVGDTVTANTALISSGTTKLDTGITNYKTVSTVGMGVPAIYGTGRFTAQTAAKSTVATFTPAGDGSFIISSNVLVTASTAYAFTVTCTYHDEGNTSRTVTMTFSNVAGTFLTSIANAGGAVPYEGVPLHIRAKGGTAITVATTGTFTTVTYNVEATIQQIN